MRRLSTKEVPPIYHQKNRLNSTKKVYKTTLLQDIVHLLIKVTVVCACFVLAFTFVFGVVRCNEVSMQPAIQDGDVVVFYRLDKQFDVSDVVVVKHQGQYLTGRVVAVAGDTVDITDEGLIVNGARQIELNITAETRRFVSGVDLPLTLGEGQVFLLGDNRTEATDSRIYGPANARDIYGKIITIVRRRNI